MFTDKLGIKLTACKCKTVRKYKQCKHDTYEMSMPWIDIHRWNLGWKGDRDNRIQPSW